MADDFLRVEVLFFIMERIVGIIGGRRGWRDGWRGRRVDKRMIRLLIVL